MKITRLVPAAVAAVALLAGCSPTPGTALIVEGTRYTERQIDEMVAGCAEALEVPVDQIRRAGVVGTLALGGVFDTFDAEITDEQIKEAAAQMGSQQLFAVESCRPLALADTKIQMLGSLDQQAVMAGAAELDVQLNPRYGQWTPESPNLIDPSGSLSVPAAALQ